VFLEGSHVMFRTNLFIRLEIEGDTTELYRVLPEFGVPFFIPRTEACQASLMQYKGFVMSYLIDHPNVLYYSHSVPRGLVIMGRHLDLLCAALSHARWTVPFFTDGPLSQSLNTPAHHQIRISAPKTCFEQSDLLLTAEIGQLGHKLLSPIRRGLCGVSSVEISGVISEELRAATIADISRAPTWDAEGMLDVIRQLMRDGKQFLDWKHHRNSYLMYDRGIVLSENLITAELASEIRASGGDRFHDNLLELHFSLKCGLAEILLDEIRCPGEISELRGIAGSIELTIEEAWRFQNLNNKASDWKPAPQQVAELFYRWAVACRISLELESAERAITRALSEMPGDLELLSEREKIAQCRASNPIT
jgi:hypothetical protein